MIKRTALILISLALASSFAFATVENVTLKDIRDNGDIAIKDKYGAQILYRPVKKGFVLTVDKVYSADFIKENDTVMVLTDDKGAKFTFNKNDDGLGNQADMMIGCAGCLLSGLGAVGSAGVRH